MNAAVYLMYQTYGPSQPEHLSFDDDFSHENPEIHVERHVYELPEGFELHMSNGGETLAYLDGKWPYELRWNRHASRPALKEAGRTDDNGKHFVLRRCDEGAAQ